MQDYYGDSCLHYLANFDYNKFTKDNNEYILELNQYYKNLSYKELKPIIIKNSSKKEPKKRPTSGFGLFGRKGIVHKNIKFNEIGYDRKKNDVRDLYIPNNNNQKKGRYLPKNIKISNKDKNIVKCSKNSKQVRNKN